MGIFRLAQNKMVIKTDPCVFSEMKIYPGHGLKFASKDGKVHYFISSKVRSLYHQKIKPVKPPGLKPGDASTRKSKLMRSSVRRLEKPLASKRLSLACLLSKSRRS